MSFSLNENTNSDKISEINYLRVKKTKGEICKIQDSKESTIIEKWFTNISNNVFEEINIVKNNFSYNHNPQIGKEVKINSEDLTTEFTINNYFTNFEQNKIFTRPRTFSGYSKYTRTPVRKFINKDEMIIKNNFVYSKKFLEQSDFVQYNNFQQELIDKEESKFNLGNLIIKPQKDYSNQKKSEIVSDYISKIREINRFSLYKEDQRDKKIFKSKFQIFESRINEVKKIRNSKISENIDSKKVDKKIFFISSPLLYLLKFIRENQ